MASEVGDDVDDHKEDVEGNDDGHFSNPLKHQEARTGPLVQNAVISKHMPIGKTKKRPDMKIKIEPLHASSSQAGSALKSETAKPDAAGEASTAESLPELHTFVVEDLEEKIRESVRIGSSLSNPSEGSQSHRDDSPQNSFVPDPNILISLESHARAISANLDVMLRDLRGSLHGMSDLTVEVSECYADAISTTCDTVDATIKNTYAMLAKVEELSGAMSGIHRLAQQIKDIKRVVDLFEMHFHASMA